MKTLYVLKCLSVLKKNELDPCLKLTHSSFGEICHRTRRTLFKQYTYTYNPEEN